MSYKHKSPLTKLGIPEWVQYYSFKDWWQVPTPYILVALQVYNKDLKAASYHFNEIINTTHELHWRNLMSALTISEKDKLIPLRIAGVPPLYLTRNELPICKGPVLKVLGQLEDHIEEFSSRGAVLFFTSGFEDQALLAATRILKAALAKKVTAFAIALPKLMEEIKRFEATPTLDCVQKAQVLCIYFTSSVYLAESGFTEVNLEEIVKRRRVEGKLTIISSSLAPRDFEAKFSIPLDRLGATVMEFEDQKIKVTISELGAELDRIEKRKAGK